MQSTGRVGSQPATGTPGAGVRSRGSASERPEPPECAGAPGQASASARGGALSPARALGYGLLLAAATAALAATSPGAAGLTRAVATPAEAVAEAGVDRAVVALLALGAWACLAWLLVSAALSALAHVPGRLGRLGGAAADRVAPVLVRQAVGALLGVSALAGVVAPTAASAAPGTAVPAAAGLQSAAALAVAPAPEADWPRAPAQRSPAEPAQPAPGSLPAIDWPAAAGPAVASPAVAGLAPDRPLADRAEERDRDRGTRAAARRPAAAAGLVTTAPSRGGGGTEPGVVVHRGDTLWSIAARHLGARAAPADVARAWPAWHEANRDVIGPDPDRLLPGQRLQPPA